MPARAFALLFVVAIVAAIAVSYGNPRFGRVTDACAADPLSRECNLVFVEQTDAAFRQLAHIVFRVTYPKDELDFGQEPVACSAHELQQGVTATFTNDPLAGVLEADLSRANGLFPYPLVVCTPRGTVDAQSAVLDIDVVEARNTSDQSVDPPAQVGVETFECSTTTLPVSTTTGDTGSTTLGETTSTVPSGDLCGDADDNGAITASDALLALRTAVGAASCPFLRCDTNADGFITTSDALRILHEAVGIDEVLECPS
jgi:hypothetical protein